MLPAAPDRALRKLVTELALADADDVEAILDELDAASRHKIKTLLADYGGLPVDAPAVAPSSRPLPKFEGYSPWLAVRLSGGASPQSRAMLLHARGTPAADFHMTPAATEALRACAAGLDLPEPQPGARQAARLREWLTSVPAVSRLKAMILGAWP